MKCVGVYKELYHQEPFDVAFCPYRISPLGAHIDHQYGKINFYKIRIPQQIRKQLLVQLDAMGFHESSIYPDMEHIAKEQVISHFISKIEIEQTI